MRAPLALAGLWLLLVVAGALSLSGARDLELVSTTAEHARERFRQIAHSEYLRDRANRFAGAVFDRRGRPLAGTEVVIFDAGELRFLARDAEPGSWPLPVPERRGVSDAEGAYEFFDLDYGAKLAVFRMPGFVPEVSSGISFADGYGADGVDGALAEVVPRRLELRRANGQPAGLESVRFVPRCWGAPAVAATAADDGTLEVPAEVLSANGPPRLLVGVPPILLEPIESEASVWPVLVPDRRSLPVVAAGAGSTTLALRFLPRLARRTGSTDRAVVLANDRGTLPDFPRGEFEVFATDLASGRLGRATLRPDSEELAFQLEGPRHLALRIHVAEDAPLVHPRVAWQAIPPDPPSPFAMEDPWPWIEFEEPTRRYAALDPGGVWSFDDLPPGRGWLIVEAGGRHSVVREVPETVGELEMEFAPAVEVVVRSHRPYSPVSIEGPRLPSQLGWTDQAGEIAVLVPPGPLVARAGTAREARSYPKGFWAGASSGGLEFTGLDERDRPRGCIYGFVTDLAGQPQAGAEVLMQGGDGRPASVQTDEHGSFRFTALPPGPYALFARAAGDNTSVWHLHHAFLLDSDHPREGEQQVDMQLWPGAFEFEADPKDAGSWTLVDAAGEPVWTATASVHGLVRVSNLPPGRYQVVYRATVAAPERQLGWIDVEPGALHVARLVPEGER